MEGLLQTPGAYRDAPCMITNSPHQPPPHIEVATQVQSLCTYVNANWNDADLIHLASFVLWRLNWIHPFPNGNGRTSRATSYLVLCARYGQLLPAKKSVIEQIIGNRTPYYQALRFADDEYGKTGDIRASLVALESLISHLLKQQLKANLGFLNG